METIPIVSVFQGRRLASVLTIAPSSLSEANAFVAQFHRHNKPTVGHKWSIACMDGNRKCGVAIVGRPVSRHLDNGETVEILRVCTDGTRNACSFLYGACARIAKDMGYARIITYTLITESGSSLRASGFQNCGEAGGGKWDCPSRPREITEITLFGEVEKYPIIQKIRWQKILRKEENDGTKGI